MKIKNIVIGICLAFLLCGAESVLYNTKSNAAGCWTNCNYTFGCSVQGGNCSPTSGWILDGFECCYVNQQQHPECSPCWKSEKSHRVCEDGEYLCPIKVRRVGYSDAGGSSCCCCYTGAAWTCGVPCTGQCDGDVLYKSTCP